MKHEQPNELIYNARLLRNRIFVLTHQEWEASIPEDARMPDDYKVDPDVEEKLDQLLGLSGDAELSAKDLDDIAENLGRKFRDMWRSNKTTVLQELM